MRRVSSAPQKAAVKQPEKPEKVADAGSQCCIINFFINIYNTGSDIYVACSL